VYWPLCAAAAAGNASVERRRAMAAALLATVAFDPATAVAAKRKATKKTTWTMGAQEAIGEGLRACVRGMTGED
jgi:hypothetical protein